MRTPRRTPHHVAIMQPYFLPYRNYFGLIRRCDEFLFFDDVQFCHKWQQRNCIFDGRGGKEWLTVPVLSRRPLRQRICDVITADEPLWRERMLERVQQVYGTHPCFPEVFAGFSRLVLAQTHQVRLVDVNVSLLRWAAEAMGLHIPRWGWSSAYEIDTPDASTRLLALCQGVGATHYVSGPAAKAYLRTDLFEAAGIEVIWHEEQYAPYPQAASATFDHFVAILDLLMNHGTGSHVYLEPVTPGLAVGVEDSRCANP
jgi:WbqC-like protein family